MVVVFPFLLADQVSGKLLGLIPQISRGVLISLAINHGRREKEREEGEQEPKSATHAVSTDFFRSALLIEELRAPFSDPSVPFQRWH